MRTLTVRLKGPGRSYPIVLGKGALEGAARSLKARPLGHRYAVITDRNVRRLYGNRLLSALDWAGLPARIFSFPAGERSKNLRVFEHLANRLLRAGFSRTDALVALGGGVVGDLGGYLAASYMRGIPYVQVPTTLLAMVDSSVGGKVAVDLPEGKNLVGHFWQPRQVFVDPTCLETLPDRERICGWVEIIKHGVIADSSYFRWLERNAGRLLRLRPSAMEEVLGKSIRIKARVVARDERESEYRKVLNYGHTIGHAIETLTGYRKYSHGEAVAKGMAVEGRMARTLGLWRDEDLRRQDRLLESLGVDISFPSLSPRDVLRVMKRDKKVSAGEIHFSLPRRIGAMHIRDGKVGMKVDRRIVLGAIREARPGSSGPARGRRRRSR